MLLIIYFSLFFSYQSPILIDFQSYIVAYSLILARVYIASFLRSYYLFITVNIELILENKIYIWKDIC